MTKNELKTRKHPQNLFFRLRRRFLVHSIPPNQFSLSKTQEITQNNAILVRDDIDPESGRVIFFSQWNVSLHRIVVEGNLTLCVSETSGSSQMGKHLR